MRSRASLVLSEASEAEVSVCEEGRLASFEEEEGIVEEEIDFDTFPDEVLVLLVDTVKV